MSNPFRRHFQEKMAELAQAEANAVDLTSLAPYQRMLYQLKQDKQVIKQIASIKDKAVTKAQMLPQYAAWVQGVLQNDNPQTNDEIFATVAIWMVDTGALTDAVPLLQYAIEHNMQASDEYRRSLPVLLFEQIAEQIKAGHQISDPTINSLIELAEAKKEDGSHQVDMPDEVRAKFFKAAAVWHTEFGNKDRAAVLFEKAISYNPNVGAKQLLKELRAAMAR